MFRKPVFWAALTAFSAACGAFAVVNLPRVFSIVEIDLEMDRRAALGEARRLADGLGLGPSGYRQAASFRVDRRARSFVELEGGGREAFARLVREGPFRPYQWVVRHFRGGVVREAEVRFRPDGAPYGFRETLAEDAEGAALNSVAAGAVAAAATGAPWNVALGDYILVDASREERPSGRIDHTFVYERAGAGVGEGRFRLRLVVSGDRLTELTHFLQVPEAFDRRHEEGRAANEGITAAAYFATLVIYGGGIAVGLMVLLRRRLVQWREWRMAVAWGVSIAFAQLLAGLNQWPLVWMRYDSALSETAFAMQGIAAQVSLFLVFTCVHTLSFMAAEGLSRQAFPHHLQLWRCWSLDGARSMGVLGQTVAGYLTVSIYIAFVVAFYGITIDRLGWWLPSDVLVNPDSLATVVPWLTPLALSLQAGFWEECLFRAVPLAGAALMGERFGHRRTWLAGAFVLQIVVFGAAHAAYPTQPSYARVVELVVPSTIFGLLYLRFGLLPAIVMHFAFDAVLLGIPVFLASTPGAWVDQTTFGLIFFVPLWVTLRARYHGGAWIKTPTALRNRAWRPPGAETVVPAGLALVRAAALPRPAVVAVVGVAGFLLWAFEAVTPSESPRLEVGRAEAEAVARGALRAQDVDPSAWTETSQVVGGIGPAHRFVWNELGDGAFRVLLGEYLGQPRWRVRYARFEGDVAARSEEHVVWIGPDGGVGRREHRLGEAAPGAVLTEDEARAVARDALAAMGGVTDMREVSARPWRRAARTDWTFIFRDQTAGDLMGGEARMMVEIAGDAVVDTRRFVFPPEAWRRADERRLAGLFVPEIASITVMGLLLAAGGVLAVIRIAMKRLDGRLALAAAGLTLLVTGAVAANNLPVVMNNLSTAQPLWLQLGILLSGGAVAAGLTGVVFGLLAGLGCGRAVAGARSGAGIEVAVAVALGLGALGALTTGGELMGGSLPPWSVHGPASSAAPWLATALAAVQDYLSLALVTLVLVTSANTLTEHWTRRKAAVGLALVSVGAVLVPRTSPDDLGSWAGMGLVGGTILLGAYTWVLRDRPHLTVVSAAAMIAPDVVDRGLDHAYGGALPGALLGSVLVACIAWWWFAHLTVVRDLGSSKPRTRLGEEQSCSGGLLHRAADHCADTDRTVDAASAPHARVRRRNSTAGGTR